MSFDKFLQPISDSNYIPLLDKLSISSFEEGFGSGSLISNYSINHGDFLAILSFNNFLVYFHNFDIDIIPTSFSF